jgi:hypothetical protein
VFFLGDPPDFGEEQNRPWQPHERRPWVIVKFNAWQHEHCSPPWWVFYQAIRHQCFAAIRREGNRPWTANQPHRTPGWIERYWTFATLVVREYAWRMTNPKIVVLLATALVSATVLVLLLGFDVAGIVTKSGQQTVGFVLTNGVGVLLAGLTGISAVWGIGALVTESIVPGTDTLAERLSLGKTDPFQRFRRHFDRTMHAVARPVLVVVDDLDRCHRPSWSTWCAESRRSSAARASCS